MAGLQRSEISFRRQGSSGLVWDDKFLSDELNKLGNIKQEDDRSNQGQEQEKREDPAAAAAAPAPAAEKSARVPELKIERSISNGGARGFRTGKVSPALEPPSPKVSACGFCGAFGKSGATRPRPPKQGKRVR